MPSKYPDSGVPPPVTPTAMHELGAAQEMLVNGLDRSSIFQVTPFQPRISDPMAVQLVALGHDTLSRVLPQPVLGDGSAGSPGTAAQTAPGKPGTSLP